MDERPEPERGPGRDPGSARDLGDMDVEEFRRAAHEVADLVADYLKELESYRVLPDVAPGDVRARLAAAPPERGEPLDAILDDYRRWIQPNITHWQSPRFMAYFPSVASGPGILGEMLAAGLNSNVMLWRNAPASTELELVVVDWLRQALGLPDGWRGMFTDTASVSSLLALVAARQAVPGWDARASGMQAPGAPRLRMYQSTEAHSSLDKAALIVGLGADGLRKIPADRALRLDVDALARAIREDRAAGRTPFCVAAVLGTTSSAAMDPVAAIADLCAAEGLWLHVDAAYAGAAALLPEKRPLFAGWERADSIVFNLHKWFFTPFDASLLLFRDPQAFRGAFSLVHEYLRTDAPDDVVNFNEYGVQLGRRFRALKVWMQLRWFGLEGMRARLREHCRLAQDFRARVEADPDWEMLAPTDFSLLCLRRRPRALAGDEVRLDRLNEAILDAVNAEGRYFLSHTRLAGRYAIRVALGNPRQTPRHARECWEALQRAARAVEAADPA